MKKTVVLFDGVCNLCNGSVQFILKNEMNSDLYFASLQSAFGKKFLKENKLPFNEFDSIIVTDGENTFTKSAAALFIAGRLQSPYKLIVYLKYIPKSVRDVVYNFIAKNRYKFFGKKNSCYIPTPDLKKRFLG